MTIMRCAQVLNGIVENVILADPSAFVSSDGSTLIGSNTAEIGWIYSGGVFVPPAPSAPVYQTTGLTFLQFMSLFTPPEQAAIITSSDMQTKLFLLMGSGAGTISLTDAEVAGGVAYLASINLIAAARVATILSGAPPA